MRSLEDIRRAGRLALVVGCALLAAGEAEAQTEQEIASRRLLLDRAEAARAAGRHSEALGLYLRAGQIQMTPSVRAFIAEEHFRAGHLAEALGAADLCLRELGAAAAVRDRAAIETHCRGLRDDLRQRVGELVVEVPPGSPAGLRVFVGGVELTPVLFGQPAATTPGSVEVMAQVGDVERWRRTVTVVARETARVRVELPRDATPEPVAPVVVEPPVVPVVVEPPVVPVVAVRPPVDRGRTRRTLGWVGVGVGGAGVAAGTLALVVQRVLAADFNAQAYPMDCPGPCATDRAAVEAASAATWVGYTAGLAFGAVGAVLLLTAPSAPARSVAGACGPGPGTAGVACGLRF